MSSSPCLQPSPKTTHGISLPARRIFRNEHNTTVTNTLFRTNGVLLVTVKHKGMLLKPGIIILFALQPGKDNVLACFLLKLKGEQG